MATPWKHPNGTYYFRVAIPRDLQSRFGSLRKYSLDTKDPLVAKQLFIAAYARFQQEMQYAREGCELTPKQAKALAGEWLRAKLEEDARQRDTGIPAAEMGVIGEDDQELGIGPYEFLLDALCDAAQNEQEGRTGSTSRVVSDQIQEVLKANGLPLEPDSASW